MLWSKQRIFLGTARTSIGPLVWHE